MSNKTKAKKQKARKNKIRLQKHQDQLKSQKRKKPGKMLKPAKLTEAMFPEETFRFWLAHGVNYLMSDYDNGIWEPLFPSIYDGDTVDSKEMADTITNRFAKEANKDKQWSKKGKTAMSWSLMTREIAYVYYQEAIRRQKIALKKQKSSTPVLTAEDMVKLPGNATVWEVFKYMLDGVR